LKISHVIVPSSCDILLLSFFATAPQTTLNSINYIAYSLIPPVD